MDSNAKLKIGVLMGGPSSEHEVSLETGRKVMEHLDDNKYEIKLIKISKEGDWYADGAKIMAETLLHNMDLAFIAMHGEYGEDGQIQTVLEQYEKPYTGSGIFASQIAIDKSQSKRLFQSHGFLTPKSVLLKYGEKGFLRKFENVSKNGPWVVKPCSRGSSVGTSIVGNKKDIFDAVHKAFEYDSQVLVEEYIGGREFTCGVLENYPSQTDRKYFALPVTEIIPRKSYNFFDYEAKYKEGATEEITPADISRELTKKIQSAAVSAHALLGCSGYSRSDFIVTPQNEVYILELNTLPGMTQTSLFPQAAKVAGIEFPELLDKIIHNALKRHYSQI